MLCLIFCVGFFHWDVRVGFLVEIWILCFFFWFFILYWFYRLYQVKGLINLSSEIDKYKSFVYCLSYFYDLSVDDDGNFIETFDVFKSILLKLHQIDFEWSQYMLSQWQSTVSFSLIQWIVYGSLNETDSFFWITRNSDSSDIWFFLIFYLSHLIGIISK